MTRPIYHERHVAAVLIEPRRDRRYHHHHGQRDPRRVVDVLTPQDAAVIALRVALAGTRAALGRIGHRIAWNISERDDSRAAHAQRELSAAGLWSDDPDLPAAVARLTGDQIKPNELAECTLAMGLLAAEVYVLACEADALGLIVALEGKPALAQRLGALAPRLLSARESLAGAIDRFVAALDDSVAPEVRDAATALASAAAADVPDWSGPKATHTWRPGAAWTSGVYEGMRRVVVALGFPAEREPGPTSDAERACVQAILARPDDDALRHAWVALAAARGEVRAALARAQLETREERRRRPPDALVFDSELVRSLVARHPEWQDEVKRLGATQAWFHRGFVEEIEIDAEVFLARARELFAVAPILHLRLRGGAARHLEALLASGALERMLAIDLVGQELDDSHAAMLAKLTTVRALVLESNRITEAGVRALYAAHQLVYVPLGGNPCGPLAELGFTHAEYPTQVVELTPLGARLEAELGPRRFSYALNPPSFDVLTVG